MIELSKHIEYLLLKHNCVIVPGLGGFVTQYVPARVVAGEDLYLPPYRSVGFNPQLTLNDGLLVQSYMQTYDTGYPETLKLIEEAVDGARQELQRNGELELQGIGRLRLTLDGQYDFEPCEAGVLSPRLYGLDAFSIRPLAGADEADAAKEAETVQKKARLRKRKNTYTLRINRELVNYAAAAIVAVTFYLCWATPVAQDTKGGENAAGMLLVPSNKTVQSVQVQPDKQIRQGAEETTVTPAPATSEETVPTTVAPKTEKAYTLVLASAISLKNATTYVGTLSGDGMEGSSVMKKGKMVRVVYGRYATEADAYAALNGLRGTHSCFDEAWVMEMR